MLSYQTVRGHAVDLHVGVAGTGPAVLLLHGFPHSARVWQHQVGPLVEAGFSVVVPEMRGYGHSGRPAGVAAYGLRALAGDVAALAEAFGGGAPVDVVGHDWGGIVAFAAAAAHPERVGRLVVMNAPHVRRWADEARRPGQALRSVYVAAFQIPALPERALAAGDFALYRRFIRATYTRREALTAADEAAYVDAVRPPGALTAALNYYRALRRPADRALGERTVPAETLVVWGERDPTLSVRLLDGIGHVVPNVRVVRIPDAGHTVQAEAPDRVNGVLVPFLLGEPV